MTEQTITLKEVRCSCGKLLGKVQEGAAHEIKCHRCKLIVNGNPLKKGNLIQFEGNVKIYKVK